MISIPILTLKASGRQVVIHVETAKDDKTFTWLTIKADGITELEVMIAYAANVAVKDSTKPHWNPSEDFEDEGRQHASRLANTVTPIEYYATKGQ